MIIMHIKTLMATRQNFSADTLQILGIPFI